MFFLYYKSNHRFLKYSKFEITYVHGNTILDINLLNVYLRKYLSKG